MAVRPSTHTTRARGRPREDRWASLLLRFRALCAHLRGCLGGRKSERRWSEDQRRSDCTRESLRVSIDTTVEVRVVVLLVFRHWEVHIRAVRPTTIVLAAGVRVRDVVPRLVRVLPDESAQVA